MNTDWQLTTVYSEGYNAGFDGKNEEFDNPYWRIPDMSNEWTRGFSHGAQSEQFRKAIYDPTK